MAKPRSKPKPLSRKQRLEGLQAAGRIGLGVEERQRLEKRVVQKILKQKKLVELIERSKENTMRARGCSAKANFALMNKHLMPVIENACALKATQLALRHAGITIQMVQLPFRLRAGKPFEYREVRAKKELIKAIEYLFPPDNRIKIEYWLPQGIFKSTPFYIHFKDTISDRFINKAKDRKMTRAQMNAFWEAFESHFFELREKVASLVLESIFSD